MMPRHGEGHESAHDKLKRAQTLEEILETALGFEATARDFYAELAGRVSKPLRELVEELAEEEKEHYRLFSELKANPDIAGALKELVERPAEDHRFSDFIQKPDLGEAPDDQAILQYALAREDAAAKQYAALAQSTPEGPVRDLFTHLAKEELAHKAELEKRYYEIVHSGGV